MKEAVYLSVLFLLAGFVSAATLHGTVYDVSLNRMKDVVVEINTEPNQKYISKNGTYIFSVPAGEYTVEAKYYVSSLLESKAVEGVSVKKEGDFVLDLILFPVVDSELIEEIDNVNFNDDYFKEEPNYMPVIITVILIILFFIILYFVKNKSDKRQVKEGKIRDGEDYYDKVLSIIKENKRVTQKEIRKQIPLSEAKISLIISELEHKGRIEKIKKGRGNILILKNLKK